MVSRKSFTWCILLAHDLDTHENTNFPWYLWIMPIILFNSKANFGKILLKGSIGKKVNPIFKIIRPRCTAIGYCVQKHKVVSSTPNPTSKTSQKWKYIMYLMPFEVWCIFLLTRETGLTQPDSIFSTVHNLWRKMVHASKNKMPWYLYSLPEFEGWH
jgi:hypothetical protein